MPTINPGRIPMRNSEANNARAKERTRLRDMANRLLSNETFVEWAGEVMTRRGFFDGREGTPYAQGARGAIVQEFEKLMEFADDGDKFLARVFRENVLKGRGY
jgi:hypothetical protein